MLHGRVGATVIRLVLISIVSSLCHVKLVHCTVGRQGCLALGNSLLLSPPKLFVIHSRVSILLLSVSKIDFLNHLRWRLFLRYCSI